MKLVTKRVFDLTLALTSVLVLAPLMVAVAIAVRFTSDGPAIFLQTRVGKGGRHFRIMKFRTMVQDADKIGPQLTSGQDPRVTHIGGLLRQFKIDELPQLINVILGDMSIVGPRPELPQFVEYYPKDVREEVLSVRPGLTDIATLEFFDEAALLAGQSNRTQFYIQTILPKKLDCQLAYVRNSSVKLDLMIIWRTIGRILGFR